MAFTSRCGQYTPDCTVQGSNDVLSLNLYDVNDGEKVFSCAQKDGRFE